MKTPDLPKYLAIAMIVQVLLFVVLVALRLGDVWIFLYYPALALVEVITDAFDNRAALMGTPSVLGSMLIYSLTFAFIYSFIRLRRHTGDKSNTLRSRRS